MFGSLPICRVCLKTSLEYIDFDTPFEVESSKQMDNGLTYLDCFLACTRLSVELAENCPQTLCSACGLELKIAYEFLQKAESADRALRKIATKQEKFDDEQEILTDGNFYEHFESEESETLNVFHVVENKAYPQIDAQLDDEKSYVCTICGEQFFSQFVLNLHVNRSHPSQPTDDTKLSVEKVECQICEVVIPLAKLNSHMQMHEEVNIVDFESESGLALAVNQDDQLIDVGDEAEYEMMDITGDSNIDISNQIEESQEESILPTDEIEPAEDDLKLEMGYDMGTKFSVIEKILTDQEKRRITKPNYKRCPVCNRHVRALSFETHMNVHNGIREFSCDHCSSSFFSKRSLQKHIKTLHNDQMKSICHICNEAVDSPNLKMHVQEKHARVVKCIHCDYQGQESKMKQHMKRRHAESKNFLCNVCSKSFGTLSSLNAHMKYHTIDDSPKSEECTVCGKLFTSKHYLKVHLKTHDNNRPIYKCEECDKQYFSKTALSSHQRWHTGETIKCVQCPKEFVHQAEYKVHLRFHTNDYPFQCERCGAKFATKGHLNAHNNKHMGWRLRCQDCGKLFSARKAYVDHCFKHSVMPYPCPHCNKAYPSRSKLHYHLKTKHSMNFPLEELTKFCILQPSKQIRTKLSWIKVDLEESE